MNRILRTFAAPRVCAAWFAPSGVVVAVTAAMTLAACGPRDHEPMAGGATSTSSATPTAVVAPQVAPVPAYAPPPPVSPSTYAGAPVAAYPADSAPQVRPASVQAPVAPTPAPVASNRVGEIESIQPIRTRPQGSGAGAVIGGVLGAVVGNQFGHGIGRAALTGAGAVGGAVAGNNVERNYKEGVSGYRVVVRLNNGHTRTFERTQVGNLHVGDRVRLDANSFHRG